MVGFFGASKETKYGPKLDIWSVGCILAEPGASSCDENRWGKGPMGHLAMVANVCFFWLWWGGAIEIELKTTHVFFPKQCG